MPSTTWYVSKDTTTADNGTSLGAGAQDYLPIGNYAGYAYRAILGFSYSFSGMTGITSAILHMKTTGQVKVAFGSDPDVAIKRLSSSFSEGTATSLSSTNATERSNEPGTTGTLVAWDVTTAENTWDTVDITTIIQEAYAAGTFYGLKLYAYNGTSESTSTSDVTEFYAREYGSNDAYIVVTYTDNVPASAPTLTSPANGATAQSLTPTFALSHVDVDGDIIGSYDLQVSTDSTFASVTHWNLSNSTSGIVGMGPTISKVYAGTALSNNTTYYWRARTASQTGDTADGAWSSTRSFRTAALPTVTVTTPSATGRWAKLTKTTPTWASPRLNTAWTFACSDGGTQSTYEVELYASTTPTASGGSATGSDLGAGETTSTATSLVLSNTLTNGNYYFVRIRVKCSHGQYSAWSSYYEVKAKWTEQLHRFDCTAAPESWSTGSINTTLSDTSAVVIEYGSNSTTTTPGTFYTAVSSLTLNRYFFYRVYILPTYNVATTSWSSLDNITLTYQPSGVSSVPDHWTRSSTSTQKIDTAAARSPGSKSLKITGDSTTQAASQLINVEPNTDYVLSGWVKCVGNSGALITLSSGPVTGAYVSQASTSPGNPSGPDFGEDTDWTHVRTGVWNSGSSTSVYAVCRMGGAAGTYSWFDDMKLEASTVATPFSIGSHQDAAVVDGGGVQVDMSSGGVFRVLDPAGNVAMTMASGALVLNSTAADQYAAIVFKDQGASRVYLDYGTSSTDTFRLLTATGAAGAETASALLVADPTALDISIYRLRATATDDVSLSSTGHAFMVGSTSGANIAFDTGEIQARNNGAAADLVINADGGDVLIKSGGYSNIRGVSCLTFAFTTAPGTGTQDCYFGDAAQGIVQMRVPFACEVVGISISLSAARTAGTLTFQGWNGSTSALVGMTAVIDGTTTNLKVATDTVTGTPDFAASQILRLRMTGSGYTPTATAGIAWVYLAHYAE